MKMTEIEVVDLFELLNVSQLRLWVSSGYVAPVKEPEGDVFDAVDVARIKLVYELQKELEMSDETIPVVLSLVDQIYGLRRELRTLTQAIDQQPEAVRHRIRRTLMELRTQGD